MKRFLMAGSAMLCAMSATNAHATVMFILNGTVTGSSSFLDRTQGGPFPVVTSSSFSQGFHIELQPNNYTYNSITNLINFTFGAGGISGSYSGSIAYIGNGIYNGVNITYDLVSPCFSDSSQKPLCSSHGTASNFSVTYPTAATGAVPEPATWAMLLVGFAGIGAVMRKRHNVQVKFA